MSLRVGDQMAQAQSDVLLQAVAAFPHLQTSIYYFYSWLFYLFFFSQGGADSSRANVGFTGRRLKSPSSLLWTCSHPAPAATAGHSEPVLRSLWLRLESSKGTALGIIPGTGTSSLKGSPERLKHPVSK